MYIKYFMLYYYHLKMSLPLNSSLIFSLHLFPEILSFRSLETFQNGNRYHPPHPTTSTIVYSRRHCESFSFFVADLNEVDRFSANLIYRRTVRPVRNLSTLKNGMNESE